MGAPELIIVLLAAAMWVVPFVVIGRLGFTRKQSAWWLWLGLSGWLGVLYTYLAMPRDQQPQQIATPVLLGAVVLVGLGVFGLSLTATVVVGAAIRSTDSSPTAAQDIPRLTAAQVSGSVTGYALDRTRHGLRKGASCTAEGAVYQGRGIWTCGSYTLDEFTGVIRFSP